jgi:hypothetical protein
MSHAPQLMGLCYRIPRSPVLSVTPFRDMKMLSEERTIFFYGWTHSLSKQEVDVLDNRNRLVRQRTTCCSQNCKACCKISERNEYPTTSETTIPRRGDTRRAIPSGWRRVSTHTHMQAETRLASQIHWGNTSTMQFHIQPRVTRERQRHSARLRRPKPPGGRWLMRNRIEITTRAI